METMETWRFCETGAYGKLHETCQRFAKVFKETTEIQSGSQVEYGTKLRVEAIPDTGYELVAAGERARYHRKHGNGNGDDGDVAVFAKQQFR